MTDLCHTHLRALLDYNKDTGLFHWRVPRSRGVMPGDAAGCVNRSHGYVMVCIDDHRYRAHRLAWFYVHGAWPSGDLDHIDTDRTNNRLSNLRPTCDALNVGNCRRYKNNTSGYKGVHWHKTKMAWFAHIRVNGRLEQLGKFSDPESAHAAYLTAARKHFGEFARGG